MKKALKNPIFIASAAVIIIVSAFAIATRTKPADNNPISALSVQDAQAQSYAASRQPALEKGDMSIGLEKAPLRIFVYEDYSSPYSAALAETLQKIQAESGDKVAVTVRPYVLKNSIPSRQAAMATLCAGEEGKWLEMRAKLFALAKQGLTAGNLTDYARQIGLDEKQFSICLTNGEKSGKIEQLALEAEDYDVQGAPTMFIGDEMILGARPYEDFVDSNGDKIEGMKSLVARKLK